MKKKKEMKRQKKKIFSQICLVNEYFFFVLQMKHETPQKEASLKSVYSMSIFLV
jgi:hypothetical protein